MLVWVCFARQRVQWVIKAMAVLSLFFSSWPVHGSLRSHSTVLRATVPRFHGSTVHTIHRPHSQHAFQDCFKPGVFLQACRVTLGPWPPDIRKLTDPCSLTTPREFLHELQNSQNRGLSHPNFRLFLFCQ